MPVEKLRLAAASTLASRPAATRTLRLPDVSGTLRAGQRVGGAVPLLAVVAAGGLLTIGMADAGARDGQDWAGPSFWAGLVVLVAPILTRLVSAEPSRLERLALVLLLGLGLYLVKVAFSPVAFTFPDELAHAANVSQILRTQHLFQANSIIPVTPLYPGLASVTAALVGLSGLPVFQAGLIVIGLSRVLLMAALFLLLERVSQSARVAGLATAIYAANPNYLFYSAEFGYEGLALPVAVLVLWAVAERQAASDASARRSLTITAVLGILAVTVTHHMTSYALIGALWAVTLVGFARHGRAWALANAPLDLAVISAVAGAAWLFGIAGSTVTYLLGVLVPGLQGSVRLLEGEDAGRPLFQAFDTPLAEQVLGFGSVLLIVLGLPNGLRAVWQKYRGSALALVLALAALAYVPVQGLRLAPAAWETANRSSEFLFLGVAFVLALAAVEFRLASMAWQALTGVLVAAYVLFIFLGGVVAGWRSDLRLPRPYLTVTQGRLVEPEGVAIAEWATRYLGPDQRVAADRSNALAMQLYADEHAFTGEAQGIRALFASRVFDQSIIDTLAFDRIRYLEVDQRQSSWDHLIGLYPQGGVGVANEPPPLFDSAAYAKFDNQPGVRRMLDAGYIAVYDVGGASGTAPGS